MNKLVIAIRAAVAIAVGVWAVAAAGGDDDEGGGGGGSTKNASVRFWIMNNGPDPVGDTEEIIRPFEKKTGIDVKVQLVGWDVQLDRIRNAAVSGEGPDVTQAGTTQVPFFAALGGFEDLSGRIDDAGGAELSDDAKKSTINSPQAMAGVKFMADLVKDGLYNASELERDGTQVENQFKGGKLAVWMGGPWVLSTISRSDDKNWVKAARDNVGVAPMPSGPAGKGLTLVGGSNLMMLKSSKNKNEAWALMKYLSRDDVQKTYADLLSFFPARLKPQEEVGNSDENHKAFYSAIKQGRTYAPIAQWGPIENAYKGRFGNILDSAAGQGKPFNEGEVKSELNAA